ncbi:class I SAM-dependent rRNA methyltransferase [Caminibacter pacificus]|uniref:23S rRNA (Cytosine1962-C5)-methyltransferase n=1 Tax=Caminibacter pacificus TaxID=1424653 RepID=A0AAJ4RED8_9BACT|nr:class I SAM-dependent rRNA methyltransferase [Caminibacter pacificus]QCI28100.1 class I SAM-dependent rRNA methyltransferase [Caminibacter pacificus]ROR41190.1 23S rRNA (cytosine1962-C5)-methyltransferase [Caminibacter pacificus]
MKIYINKSAYEKLKKRFLWIYQNEITKAPECDAGSVVDVYYKDTYVATAFYNSLSKISARIISFEKTHLDKNFFKKRIEKAIKKRELIKNTNSLRLIHSEADFLPGLIVDKYGDNLVVSFTTAGMDNFKGIIIEILIELLNPKGIYEKGDKIREKEGLEVINQTLYGSVDDEFVIVENDKKFFTSLKEGQKTGFFLDQRKNRKIVGEFGNEKTLDLFANAGGFGIYANAKFTKFVEISALACSQIEKNCTLNNLKNYQIIKADVFKFLENEKEKYDLIIIDPPAFAKTKSARKGAIKGWKYLIVNSLKLLEEGGFLALFSCSHSITSKDLLDLALSSAVIEKCDLEVIEFLKQDIDHPYLLNVPNSLYLTGVLLRRV